MLEQERLIERCAHDMCAGPDHQIEPPAEVFAAFHVRIGHEPPLPG